VGRGQLRQAVSRLVSSSHMSQQKLADLVNQSGFPLQIAVANAVDHSTKSHGWNVAYTEHAWRDAETGEDGFIDLVLRHRHTDCTFVVECKRVLEASWIFLVPGSRVPNRRHVKAWVTQYSSGAQRRFYWTDLTLDPATPQAAYCIVPGQDSKSKPMIERIGADLVSATLALAKEEQPLLARSKDARRIYFSVLVTTARLNVCTFDPSTIALHDGKIPSGSFQEASFVRFRKQLSTRPLTEAEVAEASTSSLANAKEHTVFVVQAESLVTFLDEFELDGNTIRQLA
jgi:hypothetical protein